MSGNPVFEGDYDIELWVDDVVTLNTQPSEGVWRVFVTPDCIANNNGVFAISSEGVNLDPAKFVSELRDTR